MSNATHHNKHVLITAFLIYICVRRREEKKHEENIEFFKLHTI